MTLGDFKRCRNAGKDIHRIKSSAYAEMMEVQGQKRNRLLREEAEPPAVMRRSSDGSSSGGLRSRTLQYTDHESLDEETRYIARPPSKRQTETCHEASDSLVQVFLPTPSDLLWSMSVVIPLFGRLSENRPRT